jgi:hypothetical protein
MFCTVTKLQIEKQMEDLLTFQEKLFQYSLFHRLDPGFAQKIVSRHLKLPKNENKQVEPFTDLSANEQVIIKES